MSEAKKPVLLVIRDGWGANKNADQDGCNAVKLADTPASDRLTAEWPRTELAACGLDVGVPPGIMGNSEVGHQNIGAGRIVDQEIVRITKAFSEGSVTGNVALEGAFAKAKSGGKLHYMGIASDAGVHGLLEHLYGLVEEAKKAGVEEVYIHLFTDGRDTPPSSGKGFAEQCEAKLAEIGLGKIASVCGRFWCMDRDERWDRVGRAYNMLTGKQGEKAASAPAAIQAYYDNPTSDSNVGDEFVPPTWIVDDAGNPLATIGDGDAVVFYNYRGDRPRELAKAFIQDDFEGFDRGQKRDLFFVAMTEWQKGLCENVVFYKPEKMKNVLGSYLADKGLTQFRSAETEKFPHVTFFFNDYREEPFPGEDRSMAKSPKVATYDLQPEMSADEVTALVKDAILSGKYDFVLVNYANPDMVGHTGNLEAVKKACSKVDQGIGTLLEAIDQMDGSALITADHGNADQLWDDSVNGPHTAHTLNPVEAVVYGKAFKGKELVNDGDRRLADIAPTILAMMGLEKPAEMTGINLIK